MVQVSFRKFRNLACEKLNYANIIVSSDIVCWRAIFTFEEDRNLQLFWAAPQWLKTNSLVLSSTHQISASASVAFPTLPR